MMNRIGGNLTNHLSKTPYRPRVRATDYVIYGRRG